MLWAPQVNCHLGLIILWGSQKSLHLQKLCNSRQNSPEGWTTQQVTGKKCLLNVVHLNFPQSLCVAQPLSLFRTEAARLPTGGSGSIFSHTVAVTHTSRAHLYKHTEGGRAEESCYDVTFQTSTKLHKKFPVTDQFYFFYLNHTHETDVIDCKFRCHSVNNVFTKHMTAECVTLCWCWACLQ